MSTPHYRIGNDLTVLWAIHNRDGSPYNFEGKEIHLYVTNERGREEVNAELSRLEDGTYNNVVRWNFSGNKQRVLGLYTLTIEIFASEDKRQITKDYCEAFSLVSRSVLEDEEGDANILDGGELVLSSKLDIYRLGIPKISIGTNGNWFIDGLDTGKSALAGGEGLVNVIYDEDDLEQEFDKDSVIDTFNAHAISSIYKRLAGLTAADITDVFINSPLRGDVLYNNGNAWENISFRDLLRMYHVCVGGSESEGDDIVDLNGWFYYDQETNSIGTRYNFFSEKEISANGLDFDGTGGSGGTGGESVNIELMRAWPAAWSEDFKDQALSAYLGFELNTRLHNIEKLELIEWMNNFKDKLDIINSFYFTKDGLSIGTEYNFFSEREISANGLNGEGTAISNSIYDLIGVTIVDAKAGDVLSYNGSEWVNRGFQDLLDEYNVSSGEGEGDDDEGDTGGGGIIDLGDWFYFDEKTQSIGTRYNLFSEGEISANVLNSSGSGGSGDTGGGVNIELLRAWPATWSEDFKDYALSAYLGFDLNTRVLKIEGLNLPEWINKLKDKAKLLDAFYVTEDGESVGTDLNLFSKGEVSADGFSVGTDMTLLGSDKLGTIIEDGDSKTFSANAINTIYARLVELEENGSGNVNVDLTDYYTKEQTNSAINQALSPYFLTSSFTKVNIKSTLGIYDWALASKKPSYTWSEITSKPTSLSEFEDDLVEDHYMPLAGGTITGNLRLKGSGNYGNYLYFGDGSYCYLQEDTDDHLKVYASKGVSVITGSGYGLTVNGAALLTEDSLDGYATEKFVTDKGYVTEAWVTNKGYATQSWVNNKNFATESQLSDYLPIAGGTMQGNLSTKNEIRFLDSSGNVQARLWGGTSSEGLKIQGYMTCVSDVKMQSTLTVNTNTYLQGGSSNPYLRLYDGTNYWYCQAYTSNSIKGVFLGTTATKSLKVDASGNVTIPGSLTVGGFKIDVSSGSLRLNGTAFATGEFSANGLSSDTTIINRIAALERRVSALE